MTVRFHGRTVDPVALWGTYIDWPSSFDGTSSDEFAPLTVCPNPEHITTKRHFQVNLRKDLVHCFAHCGISGTYEHAISMIEGTTQRQARKKILMHSRVGGGEPVRRKVKSEKPVMDNSYDTYLPQVALEYLESRGISTSTISRWELGWDSDALRIVIPAKDDRGRVKFLIRRTVKPNVEPRYLYPQGSERNKLLFGSCFFDRGMIESNGLVLVEGSVDTIIQQQHAILDTGGILGSKLSEFQAKQIMNLRPEKIFTMFDADAAGVAATFSVRRRLPMIPIYVCRYPKGKDDPAKLTKKESEKIISKAIPFSVFARKVQQLQTIYPKPARKEMNHIG